MLVAELVQRFVPFLLGGIPAFRRPVGAEQVAVAKFVMRGKESLVLIRAAQDGLLLHTMFFGDEVRSFARRKPGVFLFGAAAAGVLAGRLTSGVKAAHTDTRSSDGVRRDTGVGGNYVVDTGPAYVEETYVEATYTPGVGTTAVPPPPPTTSGAPLPPPPYGTVPPAGSAVPPSTPAGWDDPTRRSGGVG